MPESPSIMWHRFSTCANTSLKPFPHLFGRASKWVSAFLPLLLTGCPKPAISPIGDPLSVDQLVNRHNENLLRAGGAFKAVGRVTVKYHDKNGNSRTDGLDGTLLFLPPRHLRFDMRVFDATQILLGSNDQTFWALIVPSGEMYRWGRHDAVPPGGTSKELPIRPDLIPEALGINPFPNDPSGWQGPAPRLEGDVQQLLFLAQDADDQNYVQREFWIDRHDPRPVRKVIFRDPIGQIVVQSDLDDYRPLPEGGPTLPYDIRITWPRERGSMEFAVKQWSIVSAATTQAPSFRPPHELGKKYEDTRCVDDDWVQFNDLN